MILQWKYNQSTTCDDAAIAMTIHRQTCFTEWAVKICYRLEYSSIIFSTCNFLQNCTDIKQPIFTPVMIDRAVLSPLLYRGFPVLPVSQLENMVKSYRFLHPKSMLKIFFSSFNYFHEFINVNFARQLLAITTVTRTNCCGIF